MSATAAATLAAVSPILLVKDVQAAADHYRDRLGFAYDSLLGDPPELCIVRRDGCRVLLSQVPAGAEPVPNWTIRPKQSDAYFWVDDADALYAEFVARGATIDWEIYDTPWGMREFGIHDIDGHDVGFASPLPPKP